MGFDLAATAECSYCGNYLSASDETCTAHQGDLDEHVFRRMQTDAVVLCVATAGHKWQRLVDREGDDWLAYYYLGTRDEVRSHLDSRTIDRVPMREHPIDARLDYEFDNE